MELGWGGGEGEGGGVGFVLKKREGEMIDVNGSPGGSPGGG